MPFSWAFGLTCGKFGHTCPKLAKFYAASGFLAYKNAMPSIRARGPCTTVCGQLRAEPSSLRHMLPRLARPLQRSGRVPQRQHPHDMACSQVPQPGPQAHGQHHRRHAFNGPRRSRRPDDMAFAPLFAKGARRAAVALALAAPLLAAAVFSAITSPAMLSTGEPEEPLPQPLPGRFKCCPTVDPLYPL